MQESRGQDAAIGEEVIKSAENVDIGKAGLEDAGGVMKATRERIVSIEQTQQNVEAALAKVQSVIGASADFEAKWAAFKNKVDEVLCKSLENMRVSMTQAAVDPYKGNFSPRCFVSLTDARSCPSDERHVVGWSGELVLSEEEKTAVLGGNATVEAFAKALSAQKKVEPPGTCCPISGCKLSLHLRCPADINSAATRWWFWLEQAAQPRLGSPTSGLQVCVRAGLLCRTIPSPDISEDDCRHRVV
eukprot:3901542-Rhodomonas_salina.1